MKKLRNQIVIIILTLLVLSCNKDDEDGAVLQEITISTEDLSVTIDENPIKGQSLGNIKASTNTGTVTFVLSSLTPTGAFTLNQNTGELTVANETLFNFDSNPTLTATATVVNGAISKEAKITVTLNDLNNDFSITIDENPNPGEILGTIGVTPQNEGLSFTLTSQNPQGALYIDKDTGEVSVSQYSLFNYENYQTITASAEVEGGTNITNVNITINLNDLVGVEELKGSNGFVFEGNVYKTPNIKIDDYCNSEIVGLKFGSEGVTFGSGGSISGTGDYFFFDIQGETANPGSGLSNSGKYEIGGNPLSLHPKCYRFHLDTTFPTTEASIGGGEITAGFLEFSHQRNPIEPLDVISVIVDVTFKDGKKLVGSINTVTVPCSI